MPLLHDLSWVAGIRHHLPQIAGFTYGFHVLKLLITVNVVGITPAVAKRFRCKRVLTSLIRIAILFIGIIDLHLYPILFQYGPLDRIRDIEKHHQRLTLLHNIVDTLRWAFVYLLFILAPLIQPPVAVHTHTWGVADRSLGNRC